MDVLKVGSRLVVCVPKNDAALLVAPPPDACAEAFVVIPVA